jgi:5-methylcytosine-specific restriction endonuclease McrA
MARTIEQVREAKRLHMAQKRASNPDRVREMQKLWCDANRDAVREKNRSYYGRRFFWARMTKLRNTDRASHLELAGLWKSQRGRCALTGRRLDRSAELDHILPKTRGGTDQIGNLQWVCREVNFAKRNLTDAEFTVLCADVMRWIGHRISLAHGLAAEARPC